MEMAQEWPEPVVRVQTLADAAVVPERYVKQPSERPDPTAAATAGSGLPVIDLGGLRGPAREETVLLADSDVTGLQVRGGGSWITGDPVPSALIVNVGDQIQNSFLHLQQQQHLPPPAFVSSSLPSSSSGEFLEANAGPMRRVFSTDDLQKIINRGSLPPAGTGMEHEWRCIIDRNFDKSWDDKMEEGEGSRSAQTNKSALKSMSQFSLINITVCSVALFAVYLVATDLQEQASKLQVFISGSLTSLSLLSGIALNCAVNWFRDHWRAIICLLLSSCALLILTAACLLLLLHKHYYVALLLVLVILLLATPFFFITLMAAQDSASGYETNKAELKQLFAHSSLVLPVSFSGLVSTVIGASKNPSGQALSQHILHFFAITLFFNIIFALALMLLSCAPPKLEHQNARDSLTRLLKGFSYLPLALLALLVSMLVSSLLGSYCFMPLLFLLPFLGVTVWSVASNCCMNKQQQEEEIRGVKFDLKLLGKFADATASISFGGLTGFLFGYPADSKGDDVIFLNIFVAVTYLAFVFSFNVKLLESKAPKKRVLAAVVKTLCICMVISLALAVAELYVLLVL